MSRSGKISVLLFLVIGGAQSLYRDFATATTVTGTLTTVTGTLTTVTGTVTVVTGTLTTVTTLAPIEDNRHYVWGSVEFEMNHTGFENHANDTSVFRAALAQTLGAPEEDVIIQRVFSDSPRALAKGTTKRSNVVVVEFIIYAGTIQRIDVISGELKDPAIEAALTAKVQAILAVQAPTYTIVNIQITIILPTVYATDDPHCENMKGQKFDIYTTGNMTMVKVPSKTGEKLEVRVAIKRAGRAKCAQTFIEQVNITSNLLSKSLDVEIVPGPAGHPVDSSKGQHESFTNVRGDTLAVLIDKVTVNLQQRRDAHYKVAYLSLMIEGLQRSFGDDVGGLLGVGDHAIEAHPTPECVAIKQKRKANRQAKRHGQIRTFSAQSDSGIISTAIAN